jgi:hypothetical protein
LHAGIVSGMGISIFGIELAPFVLHALILRSSMMSCSPRSSLVTGPLPALPVWDFNSPERDAQSDSIIQACL